MRISNLKFFLLLFLICSHVKATHIVGGEFELLQEDGYTFSLSLKMYFDEVHGDPVILTNPSDQTIEAYIFNKRNNEFVQSVILNKISTSNVDYTNPSCSIYELQTLVLVYKGPLILYPGVYNDPEGYYIVWERCCRNNNITNIQYPNSTGQAFYLEFPAIEKNGQPFFDSSPALFQPLNDYACLNQPFYFDFSGHDPDGDSLVYHLVSPYAGFSDILDPLPVPSPAPYPEVIWAPGIGQGNMIPGHPDLAIDLHSGLLFVTPSQTGLFVFAVECSEYRNKVKIGEVRREFQLMVIDCPVNDPPKIVVTPPVNKQFTGKRDTVEFNLGENRCFTFSIKDPQPQTQLTVDLKAINFDNNFINPTQYTKYLSSTQDSLTFQVCFPDCPLPDHQPFFVEVVAKDNGCSLPMLDTAILVVNILPPPNHPATIKTSLPSNSLTLKVGTPIHFEVIATDPDGDHIAVYASPKGFDFKDIDMAFVGQSGEGKVITPFDWSPSCDFLNLSEKDQYDVDFIVEETDDCQNILKDSIRVSVKLETDPNQLPLLTIDQNIPNNTIVAYVGQQLAWNVNATDPDQYYIDLYAEGKDFNLADEGITFQNKVGTSSVSSLFSWTLTCDHLKEDSTYEIHFIASDKSCFEKAYDTLSVAIKVKDAEQDEREFLPPNVFTPNGDGKNDVFELDNISISPEALTTYALPKDICGNEFKEVVIVNRWGNIVFKDSKRNFSWPAKNMPSGTYFFTIKYTKKIYKGTISVLY